MFNWIGNYFARRIESRQTSDLSYSFPARSPLIKEGIFVVDASRPATFAECPRCGSVVSIGDASCKGCRAPIPPTASPIENTLFSPPGLELFIGRFFGCGTGIVHSGNVCCYGTVRRRRFYYCDNPRPNFYPLHDSDTSIILGSNEASPPPASCSPWMNPAARSSPTGHRSATSSRITTRARASVATARTSAATTGSSSSWTTSRPSARPTRENARASTSAPASRRYATGSSPTSPARLSAPAPTAATSRR